MNRRNNSPCFARVSVDHQGRGHQVVMLSSADDSAWEWARILVEALKAAGHRPLLDYWQSSSHPTTITPPKQPEDLDLDDIPFSLRDEEAL